MISIEQANAIVDAKVKPEGTNVGVPQLSVGVHTCVFPGTIGITCYGTRNALVVSHSEGPGLAKGVLVGDHVSLSFS